MKFSCHRCKTRYSIADEKVRGKILKVRCKKCSELIVVRERTLTSPNELERGGSGLINIGKRSHTAGSSPPTPPPESAEVDWFYAVDGRTEGPLLQSRLIDLLKNGGVPRGAHAWREGMGVWRPIVEVDVFAPHAPEALTVPPPPPGSPGLQPSAAPPRAPAAAAAPPAFGGPVSGAPALPPGVPGFTPQPINGRSAFEETGSSLPTLEDLADFDAAAPGNLTGPRSVDLTMPPPAAPIGGRSGPHLAPSAHRFRSTAVSSDEGRRRKLFVALPAIVALLVTIVVAVVVLTDDPGDPEGPAELVEVASSVEAPGDGAVEAPVEVAAVEDLEFTFDAENLWDDDPKPKKKKRSKKGRVTAKEKAARRRSAAGLDKNGVAVGPGSGGRRRVGMGSIGGMGDKTATDTSRLRKIGTASADALKPATLGPGEIKAVIKKHRRGLKQCLERHLKREGNDSVGNQKVVISWKISGSGRAQKIGLSGGMKESVFGRCVSGQIKNWRFPQHRGDPVPVKYPVILTSSP